MASTKTCEIEVSGKVCGNNVKYLCSLCGNPACENHNYDNRSNLSGGLPHLKTCRDCKIARMNEISNRYPFHSRREPHWIKALALAIFTRLKDWFINHLPIFSRRNVNYHHVVESYSGEVGQCKQLDEGGRQCKEITTTFCVWCQKQICDLHYKNHYFYVGNCMEGRSSPVCKDCSEKMAIDIPTLPQTINDNGMPL